MAPQNNFLKSCESLLRDNVIITGGHFRLFFNGSKFSQELNPGTLKSFEFAVMLFLSAKQKDLKADLGILINDMGSSCEEEGCILKVNSFSKEDFMLPPEYQKLLDIYGLKNHPVDIFWEKYARNTGKKHFLKISKNITPGINRSSGKGIIIKKEINGYFLMDPGYYEKIILTRTQGKDKYGTPACPLIMTGLSIIQSRSYSSSINFYYTGADNFSNIPNYFVIEKGKRVSELLGIDISIENIYFSNF